MMKEMIKGKIFLAEERGLNETDWFCSQNAFNFGKYSNEHKDPFGDLYVLNDDMLAGGRSMSMLVEEDSYIILLPLAGAIKYKYQKANDVLIAAGQVHIQFINAGSKFQILNPFIEETVNFLQIWIKTNKKDDLCISALTFEDLNNKINDLIRIFPGNVFAVKSSFSISIGKFSGRGEVIHKPETNGQFLFVINGAFEVEGRLLHDRDGLALYDANEIEMEALSNDALMLVIEIKV